ncbi:DNRLRE domain-containing protein [Streptomyces sp. NPDC001068]|uniref:DNRLRE domain-containing protein n=1 Tax=Streptomyces sp. NPDC001068 TaxID=3364544 RepID=UPI0036C8D812
MRLRSPRRARSARRTRRLRRCAALFALVGLALTMTTQQAAAQGMELTAVQLPSLSLKSLASWFEDPHWGRLPHQQSGTAAGRAHHVPAEATAAHRGKGHEPGKGRGELSAYHAHHARPARGRSGGGHFDARTSKRSPTKSTRTATVYTNADGSTTREMYLSPVNYQVGKGRWAPIDVDVRAGPDGRWHEKANSLGVDLAAEATDPALASLADGKGHRVAYALKGAAPVKGTAHGSTVTYHDVLAGTDLALSPTATGVKESVVLDSAAAGNSWTFPLSLKGLTPVQHRNGWTDLRDPAGRTVERIPPAYAFDSKVDPRSGDPATTHAVTTELVRTGGGYALRITLDEDWLHSPRRVFPVTVDDGWTTTYAESGATAQDHSYEQTIKVGSYDSGTHSAISFVNHWDTAWDASGATVTESHLDIFDTWAATCTAERFDVALVTQNWTPEGVTTYPGPAKGSSIGNLTPSVPNACANTAADRTVGDWLQVPLSTSAIQGWFSGTTADYGLAVYASTSDALHWKQFGSFNDPTLGPHLRVTYTGNTAPQLYEQFPADNAVDRSAFVEAEDLRTGDVLQTPTGTAEITGVRLHHAHTTTYDLTIGSLHTYYVEAGDTPVLVHNDSCPVLQGRYPITEGQKNANVGFRYQEHATGSDEEQWFQHNGGLTKVDGGPGPDGYLVEAKWTGNDDPNGWSKSRYNPSHSRTVFDEGTTVDQARRLLDLNADLGGSGVRYAVSNPGGAAFYLAVLRERFPEEVENGTLRVFHVSAVGMK